jgi:hypothetical protein
VYDLDNTRAGKVEWALGKVLGAVGTFYLLIFPLTFTGKRTKI